MRKYLSLFLMLLFLLLAGSALTCAHAQSEFALIADSSIEWAQENVQTLKKLRYARDLVVPSLNQEAGFVYAAQTKTNTYLFSFSPEKTETLSLALPALENVLSITVDGEALTPSNAVAVPLGQAFSITVKTNENETTFQLILTALPILSIQCPLAGLTKDEGSQGTIVLVDPNYEARGFAPYRFESAVNIGYRGNTSRFYTNKRNFSFSLLREDGEKNDVSLLGLRCDSDWILDGMYNDILRMRNHTAMMLWDEMFSAPYDDNVSGAIDGAFVEVFFKGEYKGVYCLNERLDRKQLKLSKKNGLLYRSTLDWKAGGNAAGFAFKKCTPPDQSSEWYNMEIKYPNEGITQDTWQQFYRLYQFVVFEDDATFCTCCPKAVYLDGLVDYYLLINAIGASDNMDKNMFWACADSQANPQLVLFPWDLDASFGRAYNGLKVKVKQTYSNPLFERLIRLNVDGFADKISTRWQYLRQTTLSLTNIMDLIERSYEEGNQSGAWERERKKHPYFTDHQHKNTLSVNPEKEMTVVKNYLSNHLAWLDTVFCSQNNLQKIS